MKLTENEFWRLTLREYSALSDRWQSQLEWSDFQSAKICAILANINRDPKKSEIYSTEDFMVTGMANRGQKQSPDDMLEIVKFWAGAQNDG